MKCLCGGKSKVMETREQSHSIYRRRRCLSCKADFTTFEQIFETGDRPAGLPTADRKAQKDAILIKIKRVHGSDRLEAMRNRNSVIKT